MDIIIFIFVGGLCFTQGYNAYTSEKQTKVFNKRNLPLKDVKAYNQFCGKLIYGYGIVAMITFAIMMAVPGWGSFVCMILIIVEAFAMSKIYAKNELKFLRQY